MNRCVNCLSENVLKTLDKKHIFYKCQSCGANNTKILDSERAIFSQKKDGLVLHAIVTALVKRGDKYLFLDRRNFPFGLTIPSGHLDLRESIGKALERELFEETGLTVIRKKLILNHTFYDQCKNGGELHEWHMFECECDEQKVKINDESSGFMWAKKEELKNLDLVPAVRYALYKAGIIEEEIPEPQRPAQKQKMLNSDMESMIENLPTPIIICDKKGKIFYKNDASLKLLQNLSKKRGFESVIKSIRDMATRTTREQSDVCEDIKFNESIYNLVANPMNSGGGVIITFKDITSKKQQEARDVLGYQTSLALCANSSFRNIVHTMLKQTTESLNITGCSLMILEGDVLKVSVRYSKAERRKRKPRELKLGEGVAGWVAKYKTTLAVPDTGKDSMYAGPANKAEKSLLSIAVISNDRVLGVFNASKPKEEYFSEDEIKACTMVANRIALALENDRLYRQINDDKKTLETVLSTTSDAMLLLDKNLKLVFANEAARSIINLTKDEVKNRHIQDFIKDRSQKSLKKFMTIFQKSILTKKKYTTYFVLEKGHEKILKTIFNPIIESNGACESVLIGIEDMTKIKTKERMIKKHVDQITALFKMSWATDYNSEAFISNILAKTSDILDAQLSELYLFDQNNNGRETVSSDHEVSRFINQIAREDLGRGFTCNNVKASFPGTQKIHKIILAPIIVRGETIGVLYSVNKKKNFNNSDLKWLNIIAARLSLRIESNKSFEQSERDRKQLQSIIDNTGDGIIVLNLKGDFVLWNKAMTEITGFNNLDEYKRKNPDTTISNIEKHFFDLEPDLSSFYKEVKIANADDQALWVGVTYSVTTKEGAPEYVIAVTRDISREKLLDDQQKEFIYTATHELRTPITAIKGYLSMILNGDAGKITPQQALYFNRVFSSTERLVSLVEDLLNVARIEEGKIVYEAKPFKASKLVKDVAADFHQKAQDKGVRFSIVRKDSNDVELVGDYDKSKQALSNLVDNAIKYTKKNGRVKILTEQKNNKFGTITVSDTGVGIPRKEQSFVFNKFYRVFNSESIKAGGTGLGLFIVKNLIENQNGQIRIDSKLGEGSDFKLSLPLKK